MNPDCEQIEDLDAWLEREQAEAVANGQTLDELAPDPANEAVWRALRGFGFWV